MGEIVTSVMIFGLAGSEFVSVVFPVIGRDAALAALALELAKACDSFAGSASYSANIASINLPRGVSLSFNPFSDFSHSFTRLKFRRASFFGGAGLVDFGARAGVFGAGAVAFGFESRADFAPV